MSKEKYSAKKASRIRKALKIISGLNSFIYKISNGKIWGKWAGKYPIMVLSVFGSKTGKVRNVPLIKVLDNDSPVLVASMGGMPMHPSWYFNVIANPRISVQIGSEKKYYLAKKLTDEEKDRVWPTVCSFYPDYDQYKKNTQRNIGVFSCEEKTMTKEWKKWVNVNINKGCDKNELYSILYYEGFHPELIATEMNARVGDFKLQPETKSSSKEEKIQNMVQAFKNAHEEIPIYTDVGFKKDKLDDALHQKILNFYSENSASLQIENVAGGYIETDGDGSASHTIEMPNDLRDEVHQSLLSKAEDWSGIRLLPTYVYGVRIYNRGAILKPHRDREETHIIGVIINIDQKVDSPWALEIEDHQSNNHEIFLSPGEVIFYESATLDHGRPAPFEGEKFVNVFCHYMPYLKEENNNEV
ncbi:MAG: nitroreductase family deazaflavin-dependent oxidoreductase [Gammaproteobacteria bacterium]|nr:nitroreductase family deazaflavin-dependent oxidoreductase [Gammaproteobacteria bacterium]